MNDLLKKFDKELKEMYKDISICKKRSMVVINTA